MQPYSLVRRPACTGCGTGLPLMKARASTKRTSSDFFRVLIRVTADHRGAVVKQWSIELKLLLYSARHSVLFGRLDQLHAPIEVAIKQSETEIERVCATVEEPYAYEIID